MKKYLLFLVMVLALVSCAPDPRNQADADRTRLQAEAEAAAQAQARQQDAARFALQQAQDQQTSAQWVKAWSMFLTVTMTAATVASVAALLAAAIGFSFAAIGTGQALRQAALVRANLISMDKNTRAYPLFLQHIGNGKFTLTDMTTGQVKQLDVRDSGDRDLIAGVNTARLAGIVAFEARHTKHPRAILQTIDQAQELAEVEK